MATPPVFDVGAVLTAAQMNAVGLWLVKSQTVGTGVSSVTVTGAFSADYDNYRIVYTGGTASTAVVLRVRLGSTTTGYYSQTIYATYASSTGPISNVPDNNAAQWSFVGRATTNFAHLKMDLSCPFLSTRTIFDSYAISAGDMAAQAGFVDNATSYTSFEIICSTGTITGGTIRVYGYKN